MKHKISNGSFLKLFIKNFLWSSFGAILGWLIFLIFPQFIAETVGYYGYLQELIGIKHWEKQASKNSALITILIGNGLSTLAIFVVGLLSWGKTISFLIGMLMSFILFTGPIRHGNPINFNIVTLMIAEMTYRMLAVSLGSFITTKFSNKTSKYKKPLLRSISLLNPRIYTINRNIKQGSEKDSKHPITIRNISITLILIITIIVIIAILLVGSAFFEVLAKI
jgi:hypothetical protein